MIPPPTSPPLPTVQPAADAADAGATSAIDSLVYGLPVYDIALTVIGISMLMTLWRLLRGPTLADRVVALDLLAFFAAGAICIVAMESDRPELLMVAVVVALLTFMSTAAFALYLERQGREAEEERDRHAE
jgi:multicomponent Na+:H+ antiporter subunit F